MPVLYLKSKQSHLNLNSFREFIHAVFAFVSIPISNKHVSVCFSFHVPSAELESAVMESVSFSLFLSADQRAFYSPLTRRLQGREAKNNKLPNWTINFSLSVGSRALDGKRKYLPNGKRDRERWKRIQSLGWNDDGIILSKRTKASRRRKSFYYAVTIALNKKGNNKEILHFRWGKAFKQGREASRAPICLNANTSSFAIPSSYLFSAIVRQKAKKAQDDKF